MIYHDKVIHERICCVKPLLAILWKVSIKLNICEFFYYFFAFEHPPNSEVVKNEGWVDTYALTPAYPLPVHLHLTVTY